MDENMDESEFNDTKDLGNYEYDLDEAFKTFNYAELIPTTIVYGLTYMIGFVGNCLIIFVISRYQRMRTVSNLFLASLAAADLILIMTCIPVMLARLYSYSWTMGEFCCKSVFYLQNVSTICSVLTLTSISLERFYAVIFPMKAKCVCTTRNARITILSVWFLSLCLAIPIIFLQIHLPVGVRYPSYWCVPNWNNELMWRTYEWYMLFVVLIVPFTIMFIAYFLICVKVWIVMKQRSEMASSSNTPKESYRLTVYTKGSSKLLRPYDQYQKRTGTTILKNKNSFVSRIRMNDDQANLKQVIKMLMAVVILFLISWAPLLILNLLTAHKFVSELNDGYVKYLRISFRLMAYSNSCINPICYGFMSKSFRDSIKVTLSLMIRGRQSSQSISRSSKSRNMSVSKNSIPSMSMNL